MVAVNMIPLEGVRQPPDLNNTVSNSNLEGPVILIDPIEANGAVSDITSPSRLPRLFFTTFAPVTPITALFSSALGIVKSDNILLLARMS